MTPLISPIGTIDRVPQSMFPGKNIQILLNLNAPVELDDEEKERVTRQLRDELLGLDVDSIDFVKSGKAPA